MGQPSLSESELLSIPKFFPKREYKVQCLREFPFFPQILLAAISAKENETTLAP